MRVVIAHVAKKMPQVVAARNSLSEGKEVMEVYRKGAFNSSHESPLETAKEE